MMRISFHTWNIINLPNKIKYKPLAQFLHPVSIDAYMSDSQLKQVPREKHIQQLLMNQQRFKYVFSGSENILRGLSSLIHRQLKTVKGKGEFNFLILNTFCCSQEKLQLLFSYLVCYCNII